MKICKNTVTNRYEATGYTPISDGIVRVSYVGYGDTASEAINNCMKKLFGLVNK